MIVAVIITLWVACSLISLIIFAAMRKRRIGVTDKDDYDMAVTFGFIFGPLALAILILVGIAFGFRSIAERIVRTFDA